MPKKIKANRSQFKRNQAFIQIEDCSLGGHKKGDVFTLKINGRLYKSVKGLMCNSSILKHGYNGKLHQIAPFTIGMSRRGA